MLTMLSQHFSVEEATISQTASRLGIDNSIAAFSTDILQQAIRTATKMEKIRSLLGNISLHIDSFLRCLELNRALGSKDTSQHIRGEAVDFICPSYGTPLEIAQLIVANKDLIQFDQLIMEHTWVHVSFCPPGCKPRSEVLSLIQNKQSDRSIKTSYVSGLIDTNTKGV